MFRHLMRVARYFPLLVCMLASAPALADASFRAAQDTGDADEAVAWSDAERAWLAAHPILRVGVDHDFAPYEWIDARGHYQGLVAEFLAKLAQRLGVEFAIVYHETWQETLDDARRGDIDLLSSVVRTPEREQYLYFTAPYLTSMPAILINDQRKGYIGDLKYLAGKRVAVVKGYSIEELLRFYHPELVLVTAPTIRDALQLVLQGQAEAYAGDAPTAHQVIKQEGWLNLVYAGPTPYPSDNRIAISHRLPELVPIIEKALASIPEAEREALFNRWMGMTLQPPGMPRAVVYRYLVGVGGLLLVSLGWIWRLRREIAERQRYAAALDASHSLLQAVLESLPLRVFWKNRDSVYLGCNRLFARDAGHLTPEEVIGKTDDQLAWPQWAAHYQTDDRAVIASGRPKLQFDEPTQIDGAIRWIRTSKTPLTNHQGEIIGVLGMYDDITERKDLERLLNLMQESIHHCLDCIFWIDREARIKFVNNTACRVLGYTREELLAMRVADVDPHYSLQQWPQHWAALKEQGSLKFESEHVTKQGHRIPVEIVANFIVFEGEELNCAMVRDITERKQTEWQLRRSEERFRNLVETSSDMIWEIDDQAIFTYVSPRSRDLLGYAPEEMIGRSVFDFIPPEEVARLLPLWESIAKEKLPIMSVENLNRHRAGHLVQLESSGVPFFDTTGRLLGYRGIDRDITARRQAEAALRENERFLSDLIEHNPALIFVKDVAGVYRLVNRAWEQKAHIPREQALGHTDWDIFPAHIAEDFRANDQRVLTSGAMLEVEEYLDDDDSARNRRYFNTIKFPVRAADGAINGVCGMVIEITERKRAEATMRLFVRIFECTQEAIIVTDANRRIVEVNAAFTEITGYSRDEIFGKDPKVLRSGRQDETFYQAMWHAIATTGHWSGELWNRRKNGEIYPEWTTISAITDDRGHVTHYVGIASDITLLKQHQKQLEHIAHYDALTGIPNRVLLSDRMKQALAQTRRDQALLAVCYLDLDGFKPINDCQGHDIGDQVLVAIAQRITRALREGDTVARLGGDEFVILLLDLRSQDEARNTLQRLLDTIAEPLFINQQTFFVTASIGVTLYPEDDADADTLLRHADQSMYLAKQAGKNRIHLFDPQQDQRARTRHAQRERIAEALRQHEFELFYQPKVTLPDYRVVGVEALLRWRHPEQGYLAPNAFLPVIADSELDHQLGEWVIVTALQQLTEWQHQGWDWHISINISAAHLQAPDFTMKLREHLAGCAETVRGRLQIEVLETAALDDIAHVAAIIEHCAALGISFALDDFGTGYSSLSYLRRLPADTLKIDQSFVRDMLHDAGDHAIVEGIIALARTFGRQTVAEGVETMEHFLALRALGCDMGQGYGIARPMPAERLAEWYRNWQTTPLIADAPLAMPI